MRPFPPESVMVMALLSKFTTLLSKFTTLSKSTTLLAFALILIVLALAGCSASWRPIQRERIATTLRDTQPDNARVVTKDNVVMVHHPEMARDTLRGTLRGDRATAVAIPMTEVDSLSLYRPGRIPAAMFVGGTMAFAILFVGLLLTHPGPDIKH